MDRQTGKPIADREGASERTRLEAQALADFRNGMLIPPAKERISSRLEKIRRAWELLSGKHQPRTRPRSPNPTLSAMFRRRFNKMTGDRSGGALTDPENGKCERF
ncbi:hypothetical protein LZK77_34370 (plasmid) [Rhizobium leguminosarum]|nr:hypothetical protein LZK77_34370 [Rhizobium leguminosarum]